VLTFCISNVVQYCYRNHHSTLVIWKCIGHQTWPCWWSCSDNAAYHSWVKICAQIIFLPCVKFMLTFTVRGVEVTQLPQRVQLGIPLEIVCRAEQRAGASVALSWRWIANGVVVNLDTNRLPPGKIHK
jgi:hypothetical protein